MDRLSELPDSILCHILSFLPTETSVATSILARRWRFLWAYVPVIDLSCSENPRIIDRVLLMHQLPSLISIRIDLMNEYYTNFDIETWIFTAIHRNVQYLHLLFSYRELLPLSLFTCKNLIGLRLFSCGKIPTFKDVFLPCLQKLDLLFVEFEDDETLPCLLSGTPVLEYLRIEAEDVYNEERMSYCVLSHTLKWLCVINLVGRAGHRLQINTPALEYLWIDDTLSTGIELRDLTSLIAADIRVYDHEESEYLLNCVQNLRNVTYLRISSYTVINNGVLSLWTPSFNNLTKLELGADSRFLFKLLENANNLELLKFRYVTTSWIEPQQVPKCLLSCLRDIQIFIYDKSCLQIIRYLLKNAQVLKTMIITYNQSINADLLQNISAFERSSNTCELAFTNTGFAEHWNQISPWD